VSAARRGRPPLPPHSFAARFWAKVDYSGGIGACWIWTSAKTRSGYGMFSRGSGRSAPAHRVAWELAHGPIAPGLEVRHVVCRNPACVNVAHMDIGTPLQNAADAIRDGTVPRGERHWNAKLTDARVLEARQRHASGEHIAGLAREMGVSSAALGPAIHGRTWAHVPGAVPARRAAA
jgi:hypothetical protein